MEYNSQRGMLSMPEHGRNIQKMIDYAIKIEDREERTKLAYNIVEVMGHLNPQMKDSPDFKHKLWDHMFLISDFKLDVDSPYPKPSQDFLVQKPQRIEYPKNQIKYRHYGKIMQSMLQELKSIEPIERRQQVAASMANFMKMNYLNWNRDSVSDELILEHLNELSDGELSIHSESRLTQTNEILKNAPQQRRNTNLGGEGRKYGFNNGGNRRPYNNNNNNNKFGGNNQNRKKR